MHSRRLLGMGAVVIVVAAVAGAALQRESGETTARSSGTCRDWVASPEYRREIDAVRDLVPKMKRGFAAPGLAIALAADGTLVWSETCGFADLATRRPVTPTTQFRIGSVSKPLTAALAARLAQEGQLDLDGDVRDYVAALPGAGPRVTPRQLGAHLGGIRHYQGGEALNTTHYESVDDSLRVFSDDPLVAAPGTRFHYSSYGFNLLAAAAGARAGRDYAAALRTHVLAPLGMKATTAARTPRGGTRFYEVTSARQAVPAPRVDLSDRYPSGGLLSTAEDLVRFGVGVTDKSFLGDDAQALLFTSRRVNGSATGYGFGFEVGVSPVGPVAGHTGNVVGGTAFLLIHPRTRVVAALTTNVGFVTAATPPDLTRVPEPPQLVLPFIRRVLADR
jgi:CubicO group peptidase (beta-lactamase class C family)